MPPAQVIFDLLCESSNLAADDALLMVMERAEEPVAEEAARALLKRERVGGLTGAVQLYDRFGQKVQRILAEGVNQLFPALRQCVHSHDSQVCENAIALIAAGGSHRLAYLLSPCLTHSSRKVRDAAAGGLEQLAQCYLDQQARAAAGLEREVEGTGQSLNERYAPISRLNEDQKYLVSALEQALESYDVHYRSEVVKASLWLADAMGNVMWALATEPRSKLGWGMKEQFLSGPDPLMTAAVYHVLMYGELRQPVVRMVSSCRNHEFMTALLDRSWMLCIPKIRRGFGSIRRLAWLEDGADPLLELEAQEAIHGIRLLMATGINTGFKVELLRELLLAGPRAVQRAVLWALMEIDSEDATETLRSVLSWEDEELSPIAMTELMRRQPDDLPSLMVRQLSSRSASVREVAGSRVADFGFDKYWEMFDQLDDQTRAEATRAMAKVVPDLARRLRRKLTSSVPADRVQAIRVVGMLGLYKEMQEHLYRLSHDPEGKVRSAAVAALGRLSNVTAERIASLAMNDPDARVQANAVEALDEMDSPRRRESIEQRLHAEHHRVRANAVKALLRLHVREAAEALIEMLAHESPLHRISALWVIERLGLATMIDRVVQLSQDDPDPRVRTRAAKIRDKLECYRALAEVTE